MSLLPTRVKRFTPREYYELERQAEYNSEYYDGEIFPRPGTSAGHSLICVNIIGAALAIPAIEVELPLAEIYARVEFAAGERPEANPRGGTTS
jgi:hypothetical protein